MLGGRLSSLRIQPIISLLLLMFAVVAGWQVGNDVVAGDFKVLIFGSIGVIGCFGAVAIMKNWRTGFYLFFVWMMFEDLVRKYMGNNLALFFGKDVLLAIVYIFYFKACRRDKFFQPPFLIFLGLFFWLGVAEVFNANSPSIWYGLLGLKLYFYYAPLMFVGYSLIRSDEELRKFLVLTAALSCIIALVGIAQSILGNSFLNPAHLAPDLQELGNLSKTVPGTGQEFNLPDSIFVSAGRYVEFLTFAIIVTMGAAAYLVLYAKKGRKLMFLTLVLLEAAAFLSGNRGCFVYALITTVVLSVGFLWGAPWRWRQAHRLVKVIQRSAIAVAVGVVVVVFLFPKQAGSRLAYYDETLLPDSPQYAVGVRVWNYPVQNFLAAFQEPHWIVGNGIGTASLGTQYVSRLTGKPAPDIAVEEGFGTMIVEMGVLAPILWILWTGAVLYYCWKIVLRLRQTRFFPLGFAIIWYLFLVFYPYTYGSLVIYQNYTTNVAVWLLIGVLFRLPDLLAGRGQPSWSTPSQRTEWVSSSVGHA